MKVKLHKLLLCLGGALLAQQVSNAQITLLQDYKNNHSPAIGTFQGINFREGGFSGMYAIPNTQGKEFWVCTDRGVNIDAANANPSGCHPTYDKIYAFPSYSPKIFRIRLNGDSVQILQTIAIKRPDGSGATGIINPTGFGSTSTEVPSTDTVLDCANFSLKTVPKDVWGTDAEGIVVDRDGFFWVCEEGGPSVWKISPSGVVVKRYSPYATLPGASTLDAAIDTSFRYRKNNRGFEGVTIAPNGKVYAIIQSPLLYPTKIVGENSRVHRILEIDPTTGANRMFVYLNDGIIGTGSNQIRLKDWKIGDMAAINDSTFLVMEAAQRGTTNVKRVYKININSATVVTSGLYGGLTLEALVDSAGLASNGVTPVAKTLFMDLLANGWDPALDKAEGLAIINDSTVAIGNDNDYAQFSAAEDGIATATSNLCHVVKYGLRGVNKLVNFEPVPTTLSLGVTGPSTSTTPYLVPMAPGVDFTSILTAAETVGSYKVCGTPDGLGAWDNGDGTFSVLMNHEFGNTSGVARAHGSIGSFVSKWVVNKTDLSVVSGSDLIQNINLWNTATSSYITYNAAFPSASAALNRFCSADLPAPSAFFNQATGKGTHERIFMNGEESGNEGRAFGHIATGANAGTSYELPYLGKFSWENSVASPTPSDTTVVIGMDDATGGQIYIYVGTKTTAGTDIDKAGLNNGRVYGVSVTGMLAETDGAIPSAGTAFTLADMGDVHNMTGTALNTASNIAGVTAFLRPEDGAWDPSHPNDFYFATTNGFAANSRLWRLRFVDATNPLLGGTISAVLDGSEGQRMLDNIGIDNYGHILMVEDVGGNAHIGKIWQYTIATDVLTQIGAHDTTRFAPGAVDFLTIDEEASGVIDVENILGPGKFLIVDQAHFNIPGEVVQGGQFLSFFNPDTYNAAPEVSITGNSIEIVAGDMTPSTADFTHFGNVNTGSSDTNTFVIHNTGAGPLMIDAIMISGINASEFTMIGAPTLPFTIASGSTQSLNIRFTPAAAGTRSAAIAVHTNDATERMYDFALVGEGVESPEIVIEGNSVNITDGDLTPGAVNNTDFGNVNVGDTATRTYVIKNTGAGNLTLSGIIFSGAHAADFSMVTLPTFPLDIPTSGSYTVTARFTPTATGVRNAIISIGNNDVDENVFDYALQGNGTVPAGVNTLKGLSSLKIYPNPTQDAATIAIELNANSRIVISIMDMHGKEVLQAIDKNLKAGQHSISFNTAALTNGVYFVKVSNGVSSTNYKVVVMH